MIKAEETKKIKLKAFITTIVLSSMIIAFICVIYNRNDNFYHDSFGYVYAK